jgi:hypothetical protein
MTTPRKKPKRTCSTSLKTVTHVSIELARTYRRMKSGTIESSDGHRLAQVLSLLKASLESSEFERRLAEMEAAVNKRSDVVTKSTPKIVS